MLENYQIQFYAWSRTIFPTCRESGLPKFYLNYFWHLILHNVCIVLIIPYLEIQRPKWIESNFVGHISRIRFKCHWPACKLIYYLLNGCFCKILPDLILWNYKTYSVKYFWVKPFLGDHVLWMLATDHRINFSELAWFYGIINSEIVVFITRKIIRK
jgi:hypothetical protein